MTAVNIDGAHLVADQAQERQVVPRRADPARDPAEQEDYDDPEIDRGHMVRRQDPNWDDRARRRARRTERARRARE